MNAARRKKIADLHERLTGLLAEIEEVRDEEQDCFDNMPESFQAGEKGSAAEEAIGYLEDACNSTKEAASALENIQ